MISGPGGPSWYLRNKPANLFGSPATPINNFSAFNGIDGDPGYFYLQQAINLTGSMSSATLAFTFGVQSSYTGQNRVLSVNVLSTGGVTLTTLYTHDIVPQGSENWVVTTVSQDVTSALNLLGAGSFQLQFREDIPQRYTGPAQFALDNISVNVTQTVGVPEPSTLISGLIAFVVGFGYRLRHSKAKHIG